MEKVRYIHWQDGDMWLGYLVEFPDYMTQGESLEDLRANLKDIHEEVTTGRIPCVRKLAELEVT